MKVEKEEKQISLFNVEAFLFNKQNTSKIKPFKLHFNEKSPSPSESNLII